MTTGSRFGMFRLSNVLFCLVGALGLVTAACSTKNFDRAACESHEQCATIFGAGATCGAGGYCLEGESNGDGCTSTADCQASVGFGSVCLDNACVNITPAARCQKTFPANLFKQMENHRNYIVFGSLMDRNAAVHLQRENGMEVGGVVVNEAKGFDDRRFGIVFCDIHGGTDNPYDDLSRPDAAIASAKWLVDELQVPAIIGVAGSGDTQSVFLEVIEPADPPKVLISPSASGPELTDLDTNTASDNAPGFLWRTCPSAADQGPVIADDMKARTDLEININSVAIIRESSAFGEGIAAGFIDAWTKKGGTSEQFIFPDGNDSQRSEQTVKVGSEIAKFQAVLFIAQTADTTKFLAQIANSNYPDDIMIYFPQTGANPSVFADAKAISTRHFENVRATRPSVDTTTFPYQTFESQFKTRFDGKDPADATFTAHSYDAMWLLSLASVWSITQEGGLSGLGIAKGLRRTAGGTVEVPFTASGWSTGVIQLRQGNRINANGASGPLDFDPNTEEIKGGVELLQGQADGTLTVIGSF